MKKRMRVDDGEFPLPEVLIQHVQSFMGGKEAAQTSLVSKSWYSAWSTRPNLDFDQRGFGGIEFRNRDDERFWESAAKTIQRYQELNLKIESFRLRGRNLVRSNCCDAKDLIVKAMKMGAVDFSFELLTSNQSFTLPHEVLASDALVRLSVSGCRIADTKVSCQKLKSLDLKRIWLKDMRCDVIHGLISSCPLIENLTLGKFFLLSDRFRLCGLGSVVDGLSRNVYELYKLKSLCLISVDVDALFFSNLSSNFPCLKDLTLKECRGYNYKGIQISSRSLECICFEQFRLLRANLDVPSIRKFSFSGMNWPSLLFKTASREWESDISVDCGSPNTASFLKLKKLLTCLNSSKIYLSLKIESIVEKSVDFQCLPEIVVENLMIHAPSTLWFRVLECLLLSCRPKFITLHLVREFGIRGKWENVKNDFLEIVSERNVEGVRKNILMMNRDLEEVDVQLFEASVAERLSLPLPEKIHFRLTWRGDSG